MLGSIAWVWFIGVSVAITGKTPKEDAALRGSLAGPIAATIVGIGALFFNGQFWATDFNEKREKERITQETREKQEKTARAFKSAFESEASKISAAYKVSSESNAGFLLVANNTKFDLSSVHFVVNPDMDGIIDKLSFEFVAETGFRFPIRGEEEQLPNIVRGGHLVIPFTDFIHTETQEKFSPERYRLKDLFISMKIDYEGSQFKKSVVIEPKKAGANAISAQTEIATTPNVALTSSYMVGEWRSNPFGDGVTLMLKFYPNGESFGWAKFKEKPKWVELVSGADYKGRWNVENGELRMKSMFGSDYCLPVIDKNDGAWTLIPSIVDANRELRLDFGGNVGVQVFNRLSPMGKVD